MRPRKAIILSCVLREVLGRRAAATRVARFLAARGCEAAHVIDFGLAGADDEAIWALAVREHSIIVTKDEDFAVRRTLGKDGPKIVWIRLGNSTTRQLLGWFSSLFDETVAAIQAGENLIELT
jgi:predicted nuclease of predicted toxin-antitoxin system